MKNAEAVERVRQRLANGCEFTWGPADADWLDDCTPDIKALIETIDELQKEKSCDQEQPKNPPNKLRPGVS